MECNGRPNSRSNAYLQTGECRFTLHGHQDFVKSVTVLPTSPPTLLSTSSDKTCRLWDLSPLARNEEPSTLQTIKEHTRPVDAATYWIPEAAAPDNLSVWTSDSLGVIKRWSISKVRHCEHDSELTLTRFSATRRRP